MQTDHSNPNQRIGAQNLERIRRWFCEHPCGTQRECATDLNLSVVAVGRHVKTIRSEWRVYKEQPDAPES